MAAKTCCTNLVKPILRLRQRPFSLQRCCNFQRNLCVTTLKSIPGSICGSSIHNLPGNRLLLSPVISITQQFYRMKSLHLTDTTTSMNLGVCGIEELDDFTPLTDTECQKNVGEQINKSLDQGEMGRLFAVVQIRGIQHKVTTEDIIFVKFDFPPKVGDRIRLEKVLCVGGKDFSLLGQPLLSRDIVLVDATVVEKTLSHNRVWFVYQKRKNFQKFHLYREKFTMLVINSIQVAQVPLPTAVEVDKITDIH